MAEKIYNVIETENGVPIKAWTKGVLLDDRAISQHVSASLVPLGDGASGPLPV